MVSIPFLERERTLCIVVPHTTSLVGSRFEVTVTHPVLKSGAFDVQQTAAVQAAKFVRRLGVLSVQQMAEVEEAMARVLGLRLAQHTDRP